MARKTKGVDQRKRVGSIGIGVYTSTQAQWILTEIGTALRVVVSVPVVIEAYLLILVLPWPAPRAVLDGDIAPTYTPCIQLHSPGELPEFVVHLGGNA